MEQHPDKLPDALRARLAGKQLVFCAATGRCGSDYFQHVMQCVPGIAHYHEPKPRFWKYLRAAQADPAVARDFWVAHKLPAIAARPEPIYLESSHGFAKGFLEPLLDLGIVPAVAFLHRDRRAVASSFYQIGSVPGRTEKGLRYLLSPADPDVLPLPGWTSRHDYELCYWYCLEMERRMRLYEDMLAERGARLVHLTVGELARLRGLRRVLRALGLPNPTLGGYLAYARARRQRVNDKADKKYRPAPQNSAELEAAVLRDCGITTG